MKHSFLSKRLLQAISPEGTDHISCTEWLTQPVSSMFMQYTHKVINHNNSLLIAAQSTSIQQINLHMKHKATAKEKNIAIKCTQDTSVGPLAQDERGIVFYCGDMDIGGQNQGLVKDLGLIPMKITRPPSQITRERFERNKSHALILSKQFFLN